MFSFKKVILDRVIKWGGASLLICFFAISCSSGKKDLLSAWMKEADKIKILSTTAQIGDLVAEIGGERVSSWVLIEGDLDPHSYELVKGDDEKLARADLIFYNGLGLEHGASLSSNLKKNPRAIAVAEKIAARFPQFILERKGSIDPHLWMDVSLWKEGIGPMVDALSAADPEGASYFHQKGEELKGRMEKSHDLIVEMLAQVPEEKRYLVTSHDAFQYFARRYLLGSAAPEGLSPDGQISPGDLKRIIHFLQEHKISVLFPESNVSRDSIAKIASAGKEMQLNFHVCPEPLYGDAMGGLSYLEMMERNAQIIARHLK